MDSFCFRFHEYIYLDTRRPETEPGAVGTWRQASFPTDARRRPGCRTSGKLGYLWDLVTLLKRELNERTFFLIGNRSGRSGDRVWDGGMVEGEMSK